MSDETLSIADYERVINHQQATIARLERELGEARAVVPADVIAAIETLRASVGRNADFYLYQAKVIVGDWLKTQEGDDDAS